MQRRILFRIATSLIIFGLGISAPVFAANVQAATTTVHHKIKKTNSNIHKKSLAKTAHSKVNHSKIHKNLAAVQKPKAKLAVNKKATKLAPHETPKKIAYHASKVHHSKIVSHHQTEVADDNPQDYIITNHSNLADSITANSSNTNQDFVNGGFNQQLNLRLANSRNAVCASAEAQVGKPYEWGGEDPDLGFDCSGLSQFIYAQEGIQIPRTALQQYQNLEPVKNLKAGDLVFFRTHEDSRQVSHVGIYVGDGYFVHAPRTGEYIRMSRLNDPYWRDHYAGARRVLTKQSVASSVAINKPASVNEDS